MSIDSWLTNYKNFQGKNIIEEAKISTTTPNKFGVSKMSFPYQSIVESNDKQRTLALQNAQESMSWSSESTKLYLVNKPESDYYHNTPSSLLVPQNHTNWANQINAKCKANSKIGKRSNLYKKLLTIV